MKMNFIFKKSHKKTIRSNPIFFFFGVDIFFYFSIPSYIARTITNEVQNDVRNHRVVRAFFFFEFFGGKKEKTIRDFYSVILIHRIIIM